MAGIAHTSGTLYWATIRNLLNQYGGAVVDSDAASAYDSRAKINPFARWKPVKYSLMFRQDIDSSLSHYVARWWGANDGRCGVKLDDIIFTSTSSLSGVADATTLWMHDYPTGGSADRFNPQDFRGYDPEASIIEAFNNPIGDDDILINIDTGGNMVYVTFGENDATSPSLDYMDILYQVGGALAESNLSILYLGLVAISSDGKYHGVVSLPYTMMELNDRNDLDDGVYYAMDDHYAGIGVSGYLFKYLGEYKVYPVLFANKQTVQNAEGAISCGEYIPLPIAPITVNVINPNSLYDVTINSVSLSGNTLSINYTFANKSSSAFAWGASSNTPELRVVGYTDIAENKTLYPYTGSAFSSAHSVAAGASGTFTDTVNILTPTDDSGTRYKYLSVDLQWPSVAVSASKGDIAI